MELILKIQNYLRRELDCVPIRISLLFVFFWYITSLFFDFCFYKIIYKIAKPNLISDDISKVIRIFFPMGFNVFLLIFFVWLFKKINIYISGNFIETIKAGGLVFVWKAASFFVLFFEAINHKTTHFKAVGEIFYNIFIIFIFAAIEETIFRGIVFSSIIKKYYKKKAGVWFSIMISGIIFGAMHMVNIFESRDVLATAVQSVGSVAAGIFFSAVYLRGGNIWVLIIIHFINNLDASFEFVFEKTNITIVEQMNSIHTINSLLIFVPIYLIPCFFILRKNKPLLLLR